MTTTQPLSTSVPPGTAARPTRVRSARFAWTVTGYVLLILVALVVRGLTYERYLPVFEHIDESYRFIHAYQLREDAPLGDQYGVIAWAHGFPPLQPWVAIASQRLVERVVPFPTPPDYVRALRALSAALNVGTVALIAVTGWRLARHHGPGVAAWVGMLAALPWAVAPRVVGTGNLALMDPLIFPCVALALLLAVVSIQDDSPLAAFGSLLAVVAAIYLKYLAVYALWLPFCAAAALVWRRRWRALPWIAAMGVVSAGTAGWLVFVHRALELDNRESEAFYEDGLANMLSPLRNLDNLAYTLSESIGVWTFTLTLVAGGVAYIIARRSDAPTVDLRWLALLLPYMLVNLMLTSSVDILRTWEPHWYRVRYTLPTATGLMLIWALAAAQVVFALRGRRWLAGAVPVLLALIVGLPSLVVNVGNARAWTEPHTFERVWAWADGTLPTDGDFLLAGRSDLEDVWNRPWSGYNGAPSFDWAFTDTPHDRPPSAWHAEGFRYFAATEADLTNIYTDPAMAPWLDQLYPIKTIPGGVGVPTDATFYRLLPPQTQTDAVFGGEIALVGYDIADAAPSPGDVLALRLYWQAVERPSANVSLFVHLLSVGETVPVAQFDGTPVNAKRLPLTWGDPDEVLLGEAAIALPADLPLGAYTLALGLYDFTTGARLTLVDGTDVFKLEVNLR
jgi:hypothetical protein